MLIVSDDLLGAAIQYLEELKASGVRTVRVSPETLAGLATPPARIHALPLASFAPPALAPAPSPPAENVRRDTPILTGDARLQAIADLRARVMGCIKCAQLVSSRTNVVFGVGNVNAELMFVGEAPGADEDRQGEPFVGAAGQLLTRMIQAMGLTRDSVYIANILKCRPDTPGQAYGNRKPTPEEMQTCISWLHEQIDIIRPKVLVGLGATAIEGLLGKTAGIMRLRGQWHTYRDIPLMPTYHPAFLLRNQAVSEKRKVWEDLLQVMEKLNLPITEKQRAYFLKG
jgi:uracil-DNA glycosylase